MIKQNYDVIIIGGGFYGCFLALYFKQFFKSILIIEKKNDLLTAASYNNQARIHNGYHYPRDFLTAVRSHLNYNRFVLDFNKCVFDDFTHYYAIASTFSKTTAKQFFTFAKNLGSPIQRTDEKIKQHFNSSLIEDVFRVDEKIFDAGLLRKFLKQELELKKIKIIFSTEVEKIKENEKGIACQVLNGEELTAKHVFNCTYANINRLLINSGLPELPLKHEFIEMPIIKVLNEFKKIAVTIMDGPFFGFLPFPDLGAHSLWHVRYAIRANWVDPIEKTIDKVSMQITSFSNYQYMIKDAVRYVPKLSESVYQKSIYDVKTVLSEKEENDARPILYRKDYGLKNFHIIMGGKIDNIYDILERMKTI